MNKWQTKKLGEVCDLQNGFAFKSKDYVAKSETLNFRMSNIRPGGFVDIYHNQKFLPNSYATKYKDFLLKDGDLVIAMTDMATETKILGVPTIVKTDGNKLLLNQRVGKFFDIQNDKIYIPFLKYMLSSEQVNDYYKYLGRGGLQINIGKRDILNVQIPLPPLPEQRRIVKILDEVFEKMAKAKENAEKNLQNAKELFESYLQSVFGSIKLKVKSKKWEEDSLDNVCDVEYGYTEKAKNKGDYRLVRITDTDESGLLTEENKMYINFFKEADKYFLNSGDLLMARTGASAGNVLFFESDEKSVFASYLIRIKFKKEILSKLYWYFSKSRIYWDQVKQLSAGSAQPQFNGGALKQIIFPYPKSLTEQKSIVAKLNALSAETKKLETIYKQKLADLEELKKSVLKKAFAGEL